MGADRGEPLPLGASTPQLEPYLPPAGGWRASILSVEPDAALLMPPGEGAVLPDLAAATARGGVEVVLSAGDCLV